MAPILSRLRFRLQTFLIVFIPLVALLLAFVSRELHIIGVMDRLGKKASSSINRLDRPGFRAFPTNGIPRGFDGSVGDTATR